MKRLDIRSFGPIEEGSIEFGDLTVLVGPQASGKSLVVQLLKAIQDAGAIRRDLRQYGFDWLHGKDPVADFLGIYFGGGMQTLWTSATRAAADGEAVDLSRQVVNPPGRAPATGSVFLIPAQRVLVLQDGWPRPFMAYAVGDPYCLRSFSDALRRLMEAGGGRGEAVFPQPRRLKAELRRLVNDGVYASGQLRLHSEGMRKQIVLLPRGSAFPLRYTAWSAGQREFTPLLLGLYWLIPPAKSTKRANVETVIVEEPEMGLHPRAIVTFCLLVLELLHRGYKVIVSSHSPVVLDIVWMVRELQAVKPATALRAMQKAFDIRRLETPIRDVLADALAKRYRTYYFEREKETVRIRDISSLDPGAEDAAVSGWGGLSGFSGRIADIVADATARNA